MTSSSTSTSTQKAILPDKYNYVDLFKDLLDLSSPETRANLLYIGDYQRTSSDLEYVCIWTSLAVTITEEAIERDIYLPKPGMPLFLINEHITNNFWYEVTYRSLRILDDCYGAFTDLFFHSPLDTPYPHKGSSHRFDDTIIYNNIADSFGCHRIVKFYMENTELQNMIEKDMGYTPDDLIYDLNRLHIVYAFLHAYKLFNDEQQYKQAAIYFKQSYDLWKQTKLKKKDKLGSNFDTICNRCIHVSLGYHHLSSTDAHTKYTLVEKYFDVAVQLFNYEDPDKQRVKVQQMMKSSCLPQRNSKDTASLLQEMEKEINNLISNTNNNNNEETTALAELEGSNPADKYPFKILKG